MAEPGKVDGERIWQHRFLDVHLDRVRYPDGNIGPQVLIHHPGASAVVPFLSDPRSPDPQLILMRQYRYAAAGRLWEIPAGRLEPGEEPIACAHRELREETGCTAAKMAHMTTMWTTPGFTNERIHIFLATELSRGETKHEADEFIELETFTLSTVLRMIDGGEIVDAKTMIGILFAAGFRTK